MDDSWNLDKLSDRVQCLIAFGFMNVMCGWTKAYMFEIRLDNPLYNLLKGGDGFKKHGGNGSRHYATHYSDPEWAVIHVDDPSWRSLPLDDMVKRGEAFFEEAEALRNKTFEEFEKMDDKKKKTGFKSGTQAELFLAGLNSKRVNAVVEVLKAKGENEATRLKGLAALVKAGHRVRVHPEEDRGICASGLLVLWKNLEADDPMVAAQEDGVENFMEVKKDVEEKETTPDNSGGDNSGDVGPREQAGGDAKGETGGGDVVSGNNPDDSVNREG